MNAEQLIEGFRRMIRIREAEMRLAADFRENKIFSFVHLCTGQEAAAVGVAMALEPGDRMFGNHRSHGHYLAKGGDLYRMFAEIYGKADGCCKGKGGSMHMLDRQVGFMGSTPILGAIAPIAAGSAFEQKIRGSGDVTVVFIGDGASEEGVVYETMNLAAVFQLPFIIVIENNLWAVASSEQVRRSPRFSRQQLVTSLGLGYESVNGSVLAEVYEVMTRARRTVAMSALPIIIEARVFRAMAHSGPICDESHRDWDTEPVRQAADPINETAERLRQAGCLDPQLEQIRATVAREVAETLEVAKQGGSPQPEALMQDVYAEVG